MKSIRGGNKERYDLKVRNLSKTAEARLKELAGKHHMGVEPYVRQLLEEFVLQPERILLEERYQTLVQELMQLQTQLSRETLSCIERNSDLLEQFLNDRLEERYE